MAEQEGYCASVTQEGRMYRSRIYFQHPNGQTTHFSKAFPFFWVAKLIAILILKRKVKDLKPGRRWQEGPIL